MRAATSFLRAVRSLAGAAQLFASVRDRPTGGGEQSTHSPWAAPMPSVVRSQSTHVRFPASARFSVSPIWTFGPACVQHNLCSNLIARRKRRSRKAQEARAMDFGADSPAFHQKCCTQPQRQRDMRSSASTGTNARCSFALRREKRTVRMQNGPSSPQNKVVRRVSGIRSTGQT